MRYRVDASDRVKEVSFPWLEFARENGAAELTPETVIGRPIWDFIAGTETRHLYEIVFRRVRESGAEVVLPFRCDTPSVRRFMELSVQPCDRAGIELDGKLKKLEERVPVALLDPAIPRTGAFVAMCSWCKRVRLSDDRWTEVEQAVAEMNLFSAAQLPQLTHGACPTCIEAVRRDLGLPVE